MRERGGARRRKGRGGAAGDAGIREDLPNPLPVETGFAAFDHSRLWSDLKV
jgi:hypothetical protein